MAAEPPSAGIEIAASTAVVRELVAEPVAVELALSPSGRELLAGCAGEHLRLVVEQVELLSPGATWEVYLDPPAGAVPDPADPSFLGHLAVFGSVGETPPSSRSFDVGVRLRTLCAAGRVSEILRVLFVFAEKGESAGADHRSSLRLHRVSIVQDRAPDV